MRIESLTDQRKQAEEMTIGCEAGYGSPEGVCGKPIAFLATAKQYGALGCRLKFRLCNECSERLRKTHADRVHFTPIGNVS
jgi:hypothetical protein